MLQKFASKYSVSKVMALIEKTLVMEDGISGLKMYLDCFTGLCTVTDGKTVAFSGKFRKKDTQKFVRDYAKVSAKSHKE